MKYNVLNYKVEEYKFHKVTILYVNFGGLLIRSDFKYKYYNYEIKQFMRHRS